MFWAVITTLAILFVFLVVAPAICGARHQYKVDKVATTVFGMTWDELRREKDNITVERFNPVDWFNYVNPNRYYIKDANNTTCLRCELHTPLGMKATFHVYVERKGRKPMELPLTQSVAAEIWRKADVIWHARTALHGC